MSGLRETRASRDLSHLGVHQLQLPNGVGRANRSRSRSPVIPGHHSPAFFSSASASRDDGSFEDAQDGSASSMPLANEPGPDASMEEIRQYAAAMRAQAQQFSASLDTTARLLETALTAGNNRSGDRKKRPELPAWDSANIEAWIRRTNAAYVRAGISKPEDKFAFLENVIPVDLHPTINAYFSGPATEPAWAEFITFLRQRFGRTKEQRIQTAIDGVRRNNRLPKDLAASIVELTENVTLEDIRKKHFLNEMPREVRNNLMERSNDMSMEELAETAEKYFNRDGSLRIHSNSNPGSINEVAPPNHQSQRTRSTSAPADDLFGYSSPYQDANPDASTAGVNAVHGRHAGNRGGTSNNLRRPNGNNRGQHNATPSSGSSGRKNPSFCRFHNKYGETAYKCEQPCSFTPKAASQAPGNDRGGRRR